MNNIQQVFRGIYQRNFWADDETVSGYGSTIRFTKNLRMVLPEIFREYHVKTLLDAGCGDFNWMKEVDLQDVHYHGCDVVPELVDRNRKMFPQYSFFASDITVDPLPKVDMIMCRCVLFHLTFDNIRMALFNMSKSCKYLLLTTHPHILQNEDKLDGDFRRLNLQAPPISMPEPIALFVDGEGDDGYVGIWRTNGNN